MEICGFIGPQEIIIILPLLIISVFFIIPVVIALIDILKNEFEENNKIVWVLVVLFLGIIGAILYYFIGRNQKIKKLKRTSINSFLFVFAEKFLLFVE